MKYKNLSYRTWVVGLTFAVLFSIQTISAQGVSREECFPLQKLSPELRVKAEALLLKALDDAALYTFVGQLKPMSSGFLPFQATSALPSIEIAEAEAVVKELGAKPQDQLTGPEKGRLSTAKAAVERRDALARIDETRQILKHWRCGDEIFADVQHFTRLYDGKRFFDAFVMSKPRVRRMLSEKAAFFSRWGITANSHPLEILYAVDSDTSNAREGGYGYLFGYPDYAVRFFVAANEENQFSGQFVARDFISIPAYARETGSFVYAVPKGHKTTEIDDQLRKAADPILSAYKKRRAEYIGEGKKGVVELLRDWFCEPNKGCAPSNAKFN